MSRIRSVYLTDEEDERLVALAADRHTAVNAVARIALRLLLGLPVPRWAHELEHDHMEEGA